MKCVSSMVPPTVHSDNFTKMIHNAIFIVSLCIVHLWKCSFQQSIGLGKCPEDLKVVENFVLAEYIGVWYEQYRYFISSEIGYTCHRVNYTPTAEGPLKFSSINFNTWRGKYVSNSGIAKIDGPEQSKLLIEYPNGVREPVMHWILDTDYKSYAIVWSCRDGTRGFNFKSIWIYTRERNPTKEVLDKVLNALKNHHIPLKFLKRSDQSNCCNCEVEEESPTTNKNKSREEIDEKDDKGVDEIENL